MSNIRGNNGMRYNNPIKGSPSSIDGKNGHQLSEWMFSKKAILENNYTSSWLMLGDSIKLDPNKGNTIKEYTYIPLLDNRNVNDQGIDANGIPTKNGNLYGKETDIGEVTSKLPFLRETGGFVNRVGFTRFERSGELQEYGIFFEFTERMLDYDSDADLLMKLNKLAVNACMQVIDQVLGRDILLNAGSTLLAGAATSMKEMGERTIVTDPESGKQYTLPPSIIDYDTFYAMELILNDNNTEKTTEIVKGSTKNDTVTIPACWILYVSKFHKKLLMSLVDNFGKPAFFPCHMYADATTIHPNEIGRIGEFRVIEVQEMLMWKAAGDVIKDNKTEYRASKDSEGNLRYDIYPMVVVGSKSFSTIYWDKDIKNKNPLTIKVSKPGPITPNDPYGKMGMASFSWKYGFMERESQKILVVKSILKR